LTIYTQMSLFLVTALLLWFFIGGFAKPQCREDAMDVFEALVKGDDAGALSLLIAEGCDLDDRAAETPKSDGPRTPLFAAAEEGHLEVVLRLLVEAGNADVNWANPENGATPAFVAAGRGHLEVLTLLAEKGNADVNRATANGMTPMFVAAQNGQLDVLRLLVEKGADVTREDNDGATPAFVAYEMGHLDALRLLVEKGADKNQALNDESPSALKTQLLLEFFPSTPTSTSDDEF
jgi:hypothetical protein